MLRPFRSLLTLVPGLHYAVMLGSIGCLIYHFQLQGRLASWLAYGVAFWTASDLLVSFVLFLYCNRPMGRSGPTIGRCDPDFVTNAHLYTGHEHLLTLRRRTTGLWSSASLSRIRPSLWSGADTAIVSRSCQGTEEAQLILWTAQAARVDGGFGRSSDVGVHTGLGRGAKAQISYAAGRPVWYSGPFGRRFGMDAYSRVLAFATGPGLIAVLPMLPEILDGPSGRGGLRAITVVWEMEKNGKPALQGTNKSLVANSVKVVDLSMHSNPEKGKKNKLYKFISSLKNGSFYTLAAQITIKTNCLKNI